jgi:hypothetical protein
MYISAATVSNVPECTTLRYIVRDHFQEIIVNEVKSVDLIIT